MRLPHCLAGQLVDGQGDMTITDFRGEPVATLPQAEAIDLVEARVYAHEESQRVLTTPLADRIGIVRACIQNYLQDPRLALINRISGAPRAYLDQTRAALESWSHDLDEYIATVDAYSRMRDGIPLADRRVVSPFVLVSAGNGEILEPAVLLSSLVLAGTHFIVRPSGQDLGTHLFMEHLLAIAPRQGQKLTWASADHPGMIRQLLRFSKGFSIFASNPVYEAIVRVTDGATIFEDLERGRIANRYGSGYSAAVVTDSGDVEQAAREIALAAAFNKGNKCWAVTNVFVDERCYKAMREAMIRAARGLVSGDPGQPATQLPGFPGPGLCELQATLPEERVFGSIRPQDCQMDLLVYEDAWDLALREIAAPVVVLIRYSGLTDLIARIGASLVGRGTGVLLSLGVFGSAEQAWYISRYIPHHMLKVNAPLGVDLRQPHQGSYFLLDPSR